MRRTLSVLYNERGERIMAQFGRGNANKQDFPFDESKFLPGQKMAALLLVEKEFTPFKERKTNDEIAEEVGTTRMTVHRWNTRDRNFINYKNYLSADFFDSYLPLVYSKMIDGIKNGSMKGIELYLKRIGDLDQRSEVTINDGNGNQSHEERRKELLDRLNKDAEEAGTVDEDKAEGGDDNGEA